MAEPMEPSTPVPAWIHVMRWVFLVGVWILLAGVLVQALLAGRGMFGAATFQAHAELGWPLAHVFTPLLLLVSFFPRMGWTLHIVAAAALVLVAILPILAVAKADAADVAALHPLSAFVSFALLLWVALRLRPMVTAPRAKPAAAVPSVVGR